MHKFHVAEYGTDASAQVEERICIMMHSCVKRSVLAIELTAGGCKVGMVLCKSEVEDDGVRRTVRSEVLDSTV